MRSRWQPSFIALPPPRRGCDARHFRTLFGCGPGCALRRREVAALTDGRSSGEFALAGGDGRRTARRTCRCRDGTHSVCDLRPCFFARLAGSRRGGACWVCASSPIVSDIRPLAVAATDNALASAEIGRRDRAREERELHSLRVY